MFLEKSQLRNTEPTAPHCKDEFELKSSGALLATSPSLIQMTSLAPIRIWLWDMEFKCY